MLCAHRKPERGPPQARTRATASQNAGHRKPRRGLGSLGELSGSSGELLGALGELWGSPGELLGASGELWGAPGKPKKTVLARHLPCHCETLASLGLRLVKFLIFVFMASHKQVFRLRETTTFRRLEFLLNSGPQQRPSRARETPTFRKL